MFSEWNKAPECVDFQRLTNILKLARAPSICTPERNKLKMCSKTVLFIRTRGRRQCVQSALGDHFICFRTEHQFLCRSGGSCSVSFSLIPPKKLVLSVRLLAVSNATSVLLNAGDEGSSVSKRRPKPAIVSAATT